MIERYVVSACRNAPLIDDPDFPVMTVVVEAKSRIDALRQARDAFKDEHAATGKHWTHLRIVDGPEGVQQ